MVSPELLRRYPFFGLLNEGQLKAVAMNSEEETYGAGEDILQYGKPATALYFLVEGVVDLYEVTVEENRPERVREYPVGEIGAGEPFGISALIEPYVLTSTVRAASEVRAIRIEGAALRALCMLDPQLGYTFMCQVAKVAIERLRAARVQLASVWG